LKIFKKHAISETGSYRIQLCRARKIHKDLAAKSCRWEDDAVRAAFFREQQMCTLLVHPNIASFLGVANLAGSSYSIYLKYDMNLEDAIRVCRKPSKEDRIAMCGHILQAVSFIHLN
jgi:predicted secreted protein